MESSEKPSRQSVSFPPRHLLLKPSTWKNRGQLVGVGSPTPIRIEGRLPALLAIHGFGGTPREFDVFIKVAQRRGIAMSAPLLPGHGTNVCDLTTRTFEEWVSAMGLELERILSQGDVILAGLSLGSIIAARLAADAGSRVRGLVLFANALRLMSPYPAKWLAAAEHLHLPRSWWIPKLAADIEDADQRAVHLGYDAESIRAAIEVYRGGANTLRRLGDITCPTLLVHGALDKVCPVSNVALVVQALGTLDASRVILPHSGHVVTEDCERESAATALDAFVRRLVAESPRP